MNYKELKEKLAAKIPEIFLNGFVKECVCENADRYEVCEAITREHGFLIKSAKDGEPQLSLRGEKWFYESLMKSRGNAEAMAALFIFSFLYNYRNSPAYYPKLNAKMGDAYQWLMQEAKADMSKYKIKAAPSRTSFVYREGDDAWKQFKHYVEENNEPFTADTLTDLIIIMIESITEREVEYWVLSEQLEAKLKQGIERYNRFVRHTGKFDCDILN